MYCFHCGKEIVSGANLCTSCVKKLPQSKKPLQPVVKTSRMTQEIAIDIDKRKAG